MDAARTLQPKYLSSTVEACFAELLQLVLVSLRLARGHAVTPREVGRRPIKMARKVQTYGPCFGPLLQILPAVYFVKDAVRSCWI